MNEVKKTYILDIPFVNDTRESFVHRIIKPTLKEERRCFIVTANPEIVMYTKKSESYKKIVQSADYVLPDGIGIILAAKRKRTPLKERIAGFDVMQDMLQLANEKEARCFFLGASENVNQKAVENIKENYPNLVVAGRHHGYFDFEDATILEIIHESSPDFIFVALGFPNQEEWIARHISTFTKGVFIGVGGSFDVLAGEVKRAPDIWIKWNLEWLFRLLKQPFRLRRLFPVFKFMLLSLFNRI